MKASHRCFRYAATTETALIPAACTELAASRIRRDVRAWGGQSFSCRRRILNDCSFCQPLRRGLGSSMLVLPPGPTYKTVGNTGRSGRDKTSILAPGLENATLECLIPARQKEVLVHGTQTQAACFMDGKVWFQLDSTYVAPKSMATTRGFAAETLEAVGAMLCVGSYGAE